MKYIIKESLIRLLAVAGALCLALTACLAPGALADGRRMLVIADADSLPEGTAPADPEEIGRLLDTVELPDALGARFREAQPVWADLTAPVPGLALTEDGLLLAFTAAGDGNAAMVFGFAEMSDGLRFAATAENETLGLRLGEVAVDRDLLIDGKLWHADETGICVLQEAPRQEDLDKISAEYEAAGLAGGLPAERPDGPLADGFPGVAKPKQTNYTQPAAPEIPSVGAAPAVPSVGAEAGAESTGENQANRQDIPVPVPVPDPQPAPDYGKNATMDLDGLNRNTTNLDVNGGGTVIDNGGNREQILPFPEPEPAPAPAEGNP
jgi:hypothetical protein